jgi:glycosyltransferase involved in cell wall biosynthesis
MKRKKILWLCSWYPSEADPFNGDFVQRHAKAAALFNDIHVIHVGGSATINAQVGSLIQKENLTEHVIVYKSKKGIIGRFYNHLLWRKLFKQAVEDYINENGKPDLVHVHVPVKAGLIALWVKRKYNILYLVTEHWAIYHSENRNNLSKRSRLFKQVLKSIIKNSALLTPVSDNLGGLINKNVYAKPYKVIPNTVNTDFFNYNNQQPPVEKFRFIHVSNLTYQKNAETIVQVFAKLASEMRNIELVIAGPASTGFAESVSSTGLLNQSIWLMGEISYEQVAEEMKRSHALILFSRYENLPCVVVEALCCGLPVISTPVGGIPEHLNRENSILVESENTNQLADAIIDMVNNYSRFNRKQIATSGQNKFSFPAIGKRLTELYNALSEKQ